MKICSLVLISLFIELFGFAADSPALRQDETMSIDFPDEKIRTVLTQIGQLYNLKVEIPDGLSGSTSVKLRDVTWRQIFAVVLKPAGYDYIEADGIVRVLSKEDIARLPDNEHFIETFYQNPDELVVYLSKIFRGRAEVTTAPGGIHIRVHPQFERYVLQVIEESDLPQKRLNCFPREVHFPSVLPRLADSKAHASDDKKTNDLVGTEIVVLRWVDCDAVCTVLLREVPGLNLVACDFQRNQLVITGKQSFLRIAMIVAEFLDDKKWYHGDVGAPNQALVPTPASVTPAAVAPVAPDTGAAHL